MRDRPRPSVRRAKPTRGPKLLLHEAVSERIHPGLDGLRVGQISDVHVRTGLRPRRLEQAVELLNHLAPDLVVLTGDYVCFSPRPLPSLTRALKRLNRPAYAVLGNHDHWSGAAQVRRALAQANVEVLTNEHRALEVGGATLHLVGLDDSVTGHHDPVRAFDGVPEGATRLVLAHDPNLADHLTGFDPALILSGHTHGGQVFIRRLTPYVSQRIGIKYLAGFFDVQGALLYVNRGLGASVPLRFRAPVEVTQLTLRSARANASAQTAA